MRGTEALARHLFLSPQRVRALVRDGILTADFSDLDDCREQYIEWLRDRASGRSPKTQTLENARAQGLLLDIDRKRLELAELQGQLVRIPEVRLYWAALVATARTKLLSAPNKCAALVSPDVAVVVQATVKSVIYDALNEIARDAVPPSVGRPSVGRPSTRKARSSKRRRKTA